MQNDAMSRKVFAITARYNVQELNVVKVLL